MSRREEVRSPVTDTLMMTLHHEPRSIRGTCGACPWQSNPRAELDTVLREMVAHQLEHHRDLLVLARDEQDQMERREAAAVEAEAEFFEDLAGSKTARRAIALRTATARQAREETG